MLCNALPTYNTITSQALHHADNNDVLWPKWGPNEDPIFSRIGDQMGTLATGMGDPKAHAVCRILRTGSFL